ncbi:MAG TPA: hypothetical protein VK789_18605 [Bryobacteraceae bacterium]|nr:hypothetical protein [Bryobacteraceae bacterium]
MMHRHVYRVLAAAAVITPLYAQTFPRTANVRGAGNGREGRCSVEVVVDGAAEVEIKGANAVLRNLTGQPPQWRRFECEGVLPPSPANFRFQGTGGRGRQTLIRDPRNGGVAVVRIEDSQGGQDRYAFDIAWSGGDYLTQNRDRDFRRDDAPQGGDRDLDRWHDDRRAWGRGDEWRGRIFQRVREDLDHVQAETFPGGGDQFRLGQARRELDELQDKLAAGRYDERELDDVVAAIRNVVRDNRMSPRDRDMLGNDLERLRDFRERHESYGAR